MKNHVLNVKSVIRTSKLQLKLGSIKNVIKIIMQKRFQAESTDENGNLN